ncbi:hypothetical protein [Leeuwenhoekiella sp. H156]|uniref:hypothetical protein n=1 Tax=Leeuwenhoekiella sp. H156 TaxID=3450128 RepID=UPI003FA41386
MTLLNGMLGIGTNNPLSLIDVSRISGNETIATFRTNEGAINIAAAGTSTENPNYGNYISSRNASMNAYENLGFKTASGLPQLLIKTNGAVGIGTDNTGNHKLAVEGSIGAREVKVQVSGWSDFVFENDYNLLSLAEVEAFINQNGHLKDIPSAVEVEANGIFLGEMDAKLIQKIEELTLYILRQNKETKEQKEINKLQELLIRKLEQRINKLENQNGYE